jgi:hypothetical protein
VILVGLVRAEREILAARDRGERPPDVRHAPPFDTFGTAWIEEHRSAWKASTRQQYEQILKSQLRPVFSDVRVSAITEFRVRQLLTELQDSGSSARRINLTLLVLKMIVRTAARRRLLRDDPTEHVRSLREPKTGVDPFDPESVTKARRRPPAACGTSTCCREAQQAGERLKDGRGAPEPGQDYVFTGPAGGFLNVNALRDRV